MKKTILLIKEFWKEIIIILLLVIFSKYLLKFLPFLKGWLGLFIVSFPTGIIGGYLVAKKTEVHKSALLIPGIVIVSFLIIQSITGIISFITASDEEVLRIFSKDPKWINYSVSKLRYMSIGGSLVAIGLVCPILFIIALVGAKIGKKIKQIIRQEKLEKCRIEKGSL